MKPAPAGFSSPACSLHEFEAQELTIYHNPACSKSRATLELLRASGAPVRVVEYLKTPPSPDELARILYKLGMKAGDLVRRGESLYKERYADREPDEREWLTLLSANPVLIERPIVVAEHTAVIGRPPENVRKLLP